MQEILPTNSFVNIHFPQRIQLIRRLRYVSFLINDIVLLGSSIIFFVWFTNFPKLKVLFFQNLSIVPSSSIYFLLFGIILLFGARRHFMNDEEEKNDSPSFWSAWVPVLLAVSTVILSLISLLQLKGVGIIALLYTSQLAGFCILFLGLALIPPFTRIPHRFHITQLLIFIVSGLTMFVVLRNIFALFTATSVQGNFFIPFPLALTFAFFCFGILLRWSNRGFFGNFTLDSTGSEFAFRIFLINLVSVPLITLLVFIVFKNNSYNVIQMFSMVAILLTFISSLLIWINVKLLYKHELEHLLMRETLKAHNIDLTKEEKILKGKMAQFEKEKQQYKEKLTAQNGWREAIDASA